MCELLRFTAQLTHSYTPPPGSAWHTRAETPMPGYSGDGVGAHQHADGSTVQVTMAVVLRCAGVARNERDDLMKTDKIISDDRWQLGKRGTLDLTSSVDVCPRKHSGEADVDALHRPDYGLARSYFVIV